jgi:hypothetical protein
MALTHGVPLIALLYSDLLRGEGSFGIYLRQDEQRLGSYADYRQLSVVAPCSSN